MMWIIRGFVVATAIIFWINYLLDRFPPTCSPGFVTVGVPSKYLCVAGHPFREDKFYVERH